MKKFISLCSPLFVFEKEGEVGGSMYVFLDGSTLTFAEIKLVLNKKATVKIHEDAWENVKKAGLLWKTLLRIRM